MIAFWLFLLEFDRAYGSRFGIWNLMTATERRAAHLAVLGQAITTGR